MLEVPNTSRNNDHELLTWMDGHNVSVEADAAFARIIDSYNNVRLHSALSFLRPADYYCGDPESLLAERRRKSQAARELQKQVNNELRQGLTPSTEDQSVSYSEPAIASLGKKNQYLLQELRLLKENGREDPRTPR